MARGVAKRSRMVLVMLYLDQIGVEFGLVDGVEFYQALRVVIAVRVQQLEQSALLPVFTCQS